MSASKGSHFKKEKKKYYAPSSQRRRSSSGSRAELFQVMAKVRKHPDYKDLGDNEIRETAENLISTEYFQDYFSDFNELHVQQAMSDIGSEASAGLMNGTSQEAREAGNRAAFRMAGMGNINVKLQLRKLEVWNQGVVAKFASLVAAEYGPTHAALLVGNSEKGYVVLEWDGTSLIDPYFYSLEARDGVMFEANVSTEAGTVDRELHDQAVAAGQQFDYESQIDLIFDAAVEKSKMLDELYQVIIKYNKFFHYHMFARNCQHFVSDAMKALKIQNPHSFTGRLKTYFEKLTKGVTKIDFNSHTALDEHVRARLSAATQQELEYYMCMYLHFHAVGRSRSSEPDPTKWRCEETSCQFDNVDFRIAEQESVLSRFLQ